MKKISLNAKLKPFATTPMRYKVAWGGRGSSKSWTIARMLLLKAMQSPIRVLCLREIQDSIKDSVHKLLKDQIELLQLEGFIVQNDCIKHINGSEFLFKGLYTNLSKIKSFEGVDICWIEEGESISALSWEVLDPTIRKPNSEIWISFNPRYENDVIYRNFILEKKDNAIVIKVNYNDNKYFPEVLETQRIQMQKNDPELYLHIWEGELKKNTEEIVFSNKWIIEEFEAPTTAHFYFGADWGFSSDPNTVNRMYIDSHEDYGNNCLFLDYELNDRPYDDDKRTTSTELKDLPTFWENMPLIKKYTIKADSSRPETISHMNYNGYNVEGAIKGANSVEEGIEFIRSFDKVIIHPRCKNTIFEFGNYKFKVDARSGQVTRQIVDKNNHHIDAIRYGLEDCKGQTIDYAKLLY
ncbi:PBSX family phage terminase large subunit [Aliarcobacter cryaerophilus]|uniref:PBSX family phage terminase large subunit n=1 Tax=Aliarcobacter cryaerophilus TaxID=28198 RepID=UPI003DA1DF89